MHCWIIFKTFGPENLKKLDCSRISSQQEIEEAHHLNITKSQFPVETKSANGVGQPPGGRVEHCSPKNLNFPVGGINWVQNHIM